MTAEGTLLHQRVDTPGSRAHRPRRGDPFDETDAQGEDQEGAAQSGGSVRIVRAMPLLSKRLGLIGKADNVEFRADPSYPPRPVEHKRGRPKRINADRVQLCAQAMCLEEMLGLSIPEGDLFYHAVRRRERVPFDAPLRRQVERTVHEIRGLITTNTVPRAERKPKCRNCSLVNLCLPGGTGPSRTPSQYLARSLNLVLNQETK